MHGFINVKFTTRNSQYYHSCQINCLAHINPRILQPSLQQTLEYSSNNLPSNYSGIAASNSIISRHLQDTLNAPLKCEVSSTTAHNTQHTTHNTQHTTHNPQHTTHNPQPTTHNTQHTTHNTHAKEQFCVTALVETLTTE